MTRWLLTDEEIARCQRLGLPLPLYLAAVVGWCAGLATLAIYAVARVVGA